MMYKLILKKEFVSLFFFDLLKSNTSLVRQRIPLQYNNTRFNTSLFDLYI